MTAVGTVSSMTMKFILHAATDTLPHNSNLSLWGRSVSKNCKLCGQHQTLVHVLNHCSVALQLRCFNHRHDAVLRVIADLMRSHLSPVQKMIVDLSGTNYHFPQHIAITASRPDIMLWQDEPRVVNLVELTICFETNFDQARRRKLCLYADLGESGGVERGRSRQDQVSFRYGKKGMGYLFDECAAFTFSPTGTAAIGLC